MKKDYKKQAGEKVGVYIDATNLHKGVQELGWNLDYPLVYLDTQRKKLDSGIKEKAPGGDKTPPGSLS